MNFGIESSSCFHIRRDYIFILICEIKTQYFSSAISLRLYSLIYISLVLIHSPTRGQSLNVYHILKLRQFAAKHPFCSFKPKPVALLGHNIFYFSLGHLNYFFCFRTIASIVSNSDLVVELQGFKAIKLQITFITKYNGLNHPYLPWSSLTCLAGTHSFEYGQTIC